MINRLSVPQRRVLSRWIDLAYRTNQRSVLSTSARFRPVVIFRMLKIGGGGTGMGGALVVTGLANRLGVGLAAGTGFGGTFSTAGLGATAGIAAAVIGAAAPTDARAVL